jgi:hypothetical protein
MTSDTTGGWGRTLWWLLIGMHGQGVENERAELVRIRKNPELSSEVRPFQ